jgi:hypothetical protein
MLGTRRSCVSDGHKEGRVFLAMRVDLRMESMNYEEQHDQAVKQVHGAMRQQAPVPMCFGLLTIRPMPLST